MAAQAKPDMTAASQPSPETTQQAQIHTHPAFELLRSRRIPSLNLTVSEFRHRKTGAMHYHMQSSNTENVFLVAFRTVPEDSTGVAHILEHTALCGSEKYPVRDPFFMMIRRSLNTFMNAFTSSDWTAYPFASKNRKDFNNLLGVYLDAAFFSRLHPLDFAQEGHRLEFAEPDNPDSELQFKGVVFNEMKGAMSSANSVLWQTISKHLFPTTTYHFNSGGEPTDIPDLSYDQLVSFYKSHYHPSNAVFMTFGDIPPVEHQTRFENLALSRFEHNDYQIEVSDEKRYLSPIRVDEYYACAEEDVSERTHVVLAWLLDKSTNLSELFEAQLLNSVLLDNSSSPLLQALETSDLGESPSPMCGLEDSNREMSFLAGLEGCRESDKLEIEKFILSTLEKIAEEGVDQKQVEAALHQLELSQREISGDSYPYGLQLILTALSTAIHRGDPVELLDIDPVLEKLRSDINDPDYIPALIRKNLLENPHRLTLALIPDQGLDARKVAAEKARLAQIKASLSPEQSAQIVSQATELLERQGSEDRPDILPKVGLEDVPEVITEPRGETRKIHNSNHEVSLYGQGTNGLVYQQMVMRLPQLPQEILQYLPVFTSCLPELGIGQRDYTEVQSWQAQVSGGLNCFSSVRADGDDEQHQSAFVTLSTKGLQHNNHELSAMIRETFEGVRLDEISRLRELIDQIVARKEASITSQGHVLAMNLASSRMSPCAWLTHETAGLEGIRRLKALKEKLSADDAVEEIFSQFASILDKLRNTAPQFLLIAEPELLEDKLAELQQCWREYPGLDDCQGLSLAPVRESVRQAWSTTTQVNFVARAYPTVPTDHADGPVLHVLAGFMRNGYLHRAIREQGGAYGGGAGQDGNSASFRFFSYRDPRLSETLQDFDSAVQWVQNGKHGSSQLEEAILGVIATMDKPSSPAGEAKKAFYNRLFGRTIEQRMTFRQRVLTTSIEDLRRVAAEYLVPDRASNGIITSSESAKGLEKDGFEITNI